MHASDVRVKSTNSFIYPPPPTLLLYALFHTECLLLRLPPVRILYNNDELPTADSNPSLPPTLPPSTRPPLSCVMIELLLLLFVSLFASAVGPLFRNSRCSSPCSGLPPRVGARVRQGGVSCPNPRPLSLETRRCFLAILRFGERRLGDSWRYLRAFLRMLKGGGESCEKKRIGGWGRFGAVKGKRAPGECDL